MPTPVRAAISQEAEPFDFVSDEDFALLRGQFVYRQFECREKQALRA